MLLPCRRPPLVSGILGLEISKVLVVFHGHIAGGSKAAASWIEANRALRYAYLEISLGNQRVCRVSTATTGVGRTNPKTLAQILKSRVKLKKGCKFWGDPAKVRCAANGVDLEGRKPVGSLAGQPPGSSG